MGFPILFFAFDRAIIGFRLFDNTLPLIRGKEYLKKLKKQKRKK